MRQPFKTVAILGLTLTILIPCILGSNLVNTSNGFQIYGYYVKSTANEPEVYPGSTYVLLSIDILYNGLQRVYVYSACLDLPPGFTPSRGYSSCSGPILPNGSTYRVVEPGDVVNFRFYIDVSKEVIPGGYAVGLRIRYGDGISIYNEVNVGVITMTVLQYPPLKLEVVDVYWSPDAYPGSQSVYLNLVLRNVGRSTIVQGNGLIELPVNVFTPNNIRFSLINLGINSSTVISLGPLSIYSEVSAGVYQAKLKINATLRTNDGVQYLNNSVVSFNVFIRSSPAVILNVVDYGFTDVKVCRGTVNTRIYVTILNKDFVTIRSTIARFTIDFGGTFANNSRESIYIHTAPISYGDTVTLYSNPVIIGRGVDRVVAILKITIFGDRDGAEFWSNQVYVLVIPVRIPSINLNIASVFWSSGSAFPGSKDVNLNIVLENIDVVNVRDAVVTLELPTVFYPRKLTLSDIDIPFGTRKTITFTSISISPNAKAGAYNALLKISGIAYTQTNTFYPVEIELPFLLLIEKQENVSCLEVVDSGWTTGKAYLRMVNTGIYVYLRVVNPFYTIVNPQVTFYLPPGMMFQSGSKNASVSLDDRYVYGQLIYAEVQGVDVIVLEPGFYPITLVMKYLAVDSGGNDFWVTEVKVLLLAIDKPNLNMTIVDVKWYNQVTTGYTSGASLEFTLQSLSIDMIKTIIAIINNSFPTITREGSRSIVEALSTSIRYGDVITIRFDDLEITCEECYSINITLLLSVIKVVRSAYYEVEDYINILVPITSKIKIFNIIAVNTYYGSTSSPILPSARGIKINIVLANTKPYDIAWIKPEIKDLDKVFANVNNVEGSCLSGVARGGTCNLILDVDINQDVIPGQHFVILKLLYAVRGGNALAISNESIEIPIIVADVNYYMPSLRLLTWYWGSQAPIRVYPGQRNAPLTIEIVNDGVYPVNGVEITAKSEDQNLIPIVDKALCSITLSPKSICSAVLYFDISINAINFVMLNIIVKYTFTEFGVNITSEMIYPVTLMIDTYAGGGGLHLVDASWNNNWPVYPQTENATYVVRLYNSWPYRVSGIKAILILPKGFRSKGEHVATTYIPGPIPSLQTVDISFDVSVTNNVEPGVYATTLHLEYVVESGHPHIKISENISLILRVHDIKNSVSLIRTEWIASSPEPGTYGAILVVAIRNNYVPSIKGSILELYTNKYIVLADTNASYGAVIASNIPPESIAMTMQIPSTLLRYEQLNELLKQAILGGVTGTYSYGDVMYFYIRLNLLMDKPGIYNISAYLNFVDQWNNIRRIPLEIPVNVLGSARLITIDVTQPIVIENGVANLTLVLRNKGSAPLHNVYIYVVPQTPLLIPSSNVAYIDVVPPGIPAYTSFKLIYNPVALFTGMAVQYVRYTTAVFIITVVFRDPMGITRYVNLSLASVIEPFIELKVVNIKAEASPTHLYVSGVIINYGLATARSVEVQVVDDKGEILGSSFVGDVDPASQYAFRLEAKGLSSTSCTLRIVYRDEYNAIKFLDLPLTITLKITTETTAVTTVQGGEANTQRFMVIIAVVIFLVIVGYFLYKFINKYTRKLEKEVET